MDLIGSLEESDSAELCGVTFDFASVFSLSLSDRNQNF